MIDPRKSLRHELHRDASSRLVVSTVGFESIDRVLNIPATEYLYISTHIIYFFVPTEKHVSFFSKFICCRVRVYMLTLTSIDYSRSLFIERSRTHSSSSTQLIQLIPTRERFASVRPSVELFFVISMSTVKKGNHLCFWLIFRFSSRFVKKKAEEGKHLKEDRLLERGGGGARDWIFISTCLSNSTASR